MGSREIIKQEIKFKLKEFYKDFCKHVDEHKEIMDFSRVYPLFTTSDSVIDVVVGFGPQTDDVLADDIKLKKVDVPHMTNVQNAADNLQEAIDYINHIEGIDENS